MYTSTRWALGAACCLCFLAGLAVTAVIATRHDSLAQQSVDEMMYAVYALAGAGASFFVLYFLTAAQSQPE